ncbi:MAG: adenosine kinase [Pseudomonadales bacterium]|nr:adenosine kinase [Pseudomonadales bacterium]
MMFDVFGLGNALVDMEFRVDDSFLQRQSIPKGHMTLVDEARLDALIGDLDGLRPEQLSGGSAANTIIAVQAFGARTFYTCKVADDPTGNYFLKDMAAAGVTINTNAQAASGKSGHCLVLITPDAERSMNTFLGISSELSTGDIDTEALARSRYFYVEGYLSSSPGSCAAATLAREIAEAEGVKTALSLSDPSMVEFCRDGLIQILGNGVDHLFCNAEEALTWAGTDRLDIAVKELSDISRNLNVTLGSRGCLVVNARTRHTLTGYPTQAVDTTGAGDMYAGACLYGWSVGMSSEQAAAFGNYAAARLVAHYGARLRTLPEYPETLKAFSSLTPG